jgi:hypothetical protein
MMKYLLFGGLALCVIGAVIHSGNDSSPSSSPSQTVQKEGCDEDAARKTIDMATLANPALLLRVKDGSHVRYTFTADGWSVASPHASSQFTQLALALSGAEGCIAHSELLHIEFYRRDGQHVASVNPWSGVSVDGE